MSTKIKMKEILTFLGGVVLGACIYVILSSKSENTTFVVEDVKVEDEKVLYNVTSVNSFESFWYHNDTLNLAKGDTLRLTK